MLVTMSSSIRRSYTLWLQGTDMRSQKVKKLLKKIAEKEGITFEQMKEIAEAPFRFTAKKIAEGDKKTLTFFNVRIMKFGIFAVKQGRREFFKKIMNEKSTGTGEQQAGNSS